jgi:outer membrane lipoprotein SlyB
MSQEPPSQSSGNKKPLSPKEEKQAGGMQPTTKQQDDPAVRKVKDGKALTDEDVVIAEGSALAASAGFVAPAGATAVGIATTGMAVPLLLTTSAGLMAGAVGWGATYEAVTTAKSAEMYAREDDRFAANLQQKQNMIVLANGNFREQLADPKTGKVDLNNIETLNKLSVLAQKEIYKQEEIMKENSSYVPRWMRGSESVMKQEAARREMKIAQSAKEEINQHIRELKEFQQRDAAERAKTDPVVSQSKQSITGADMAASQPKGRVYTASTQPTPDEGKVNR